MKLALGLFAFALPVSAQARTTLHEVQEALRRAGNPWTAASSSASERYQGRMNAFGLRGRLEGDEFSVTRDDFESHFQLPARFDWRDVDGVGWLPPVRDQGQCGSCVAFSALGALEGRLNVANGTPALNLDLSEQYLFGKIGSCDRGSWPSSAAASLRSAGVPDEACVPYASGRMGEDVNARPCSDIKNRILKISGSRTLSSAADIKKALLQGPLMTSMTVYDDFMYYTSGIYQHLTGQTAGGHAVALVGYDDSEGYWIVRNSWGESWGEQGYFRIKYNDDSGLGRSATAFETASPGQAVRLALPQSYDVVKGSMNLQVEKMLDAAIREIRFHLSRAGGGAPLLSGNLPLGETLLDISGLPNGTYELALQSVSENGVVSRPQFTLVHIANAPLATTASLESDSNLGRPLKGRIEFRARSSASSVPFTELEVTLRQTDGDYRRTIHLRDPGALIKFGWRTEKAPNGTYAIELVGRTGGLYEYRAPALTVRTQN